MNFDLKNSFKNKFMDKNEKARSDFKAVWPLNGRADSMGVKRFTIKNTS